jgi:hypothetical protein
VRGEGELLSVPLLSVQVHVLLGYRVGHGTQCVVKGSYCQSHYCTCSVGVQGGARDPVRGEGELLSVPLLYMFCWCTGWGTGPSAW